MVYFEIWTIKSELVMRTYILIGFLSLIFIWITACNNDGNKIVFYNDCEYLRGWNSENKPYIENTAHSYRCASVTDTNNRFSVGFFFPYNEISKGKIKKVKVSSWIYFSYCVGQGDLIFSIINKEKTKFFMFEKIALQEQIIDYRSWIKMEQTYVISDTIPSDAYFQFYVYNTGLFPIYADDFSLTFYD